MKPTSSNPGAATVLRDPVHFVAFGFGAGLSPLAPGTAGTGIGVLAFIALSGLPLWAYGLAVLALFGLGCGVCGESARRLGVHDHGGIVFDEIVGYLVAAAPLLWETGRWDGWPGWLGAFAAFRVFDIFKPWPIRLADRRVHGGFGIMLDDALAGLAAASILALALW